MRSTLVFSFALVAALSGSAFAAIESIDTGTLLTEMSDLHRLADFPEMPYKTVQFSSFDRRSNEPGGPDWFGNADGFGNEPIPGFEAVIREPDAEGVGEYLICDVAGAGAIVRTWTAWIHGTIRLYLDGADEPVYDGPADTFLRCPYRAWVVACGLDEADLAGTFAQRDAGYCPIPFAKRCRMTWVGRIKRTHFYHVQVRLYESAVDVTTFQPDDLKTHAEAFRKTARVLAHPDQEYAHQSSEEATPISATIESGQKQEVLKLEGPKAIERLTLKVTADDLNRALRQTVLHIICDDYPWGQVQAPVGDFFGSAPGVNPYDTLPFTVAPDGTMTCRYVMPFKKSLRILLENRGKQSIEATGSALPVPYEWNDERSMHFRARWRVDHNLTASHEPGVDMPFLIANGSGVYVGTTLLLLNPCRPPTTYGGWWGEGDEKVFVDDDAVPSTFGTGSEDYFNYSYSVPDIFAHPYCGQPRNDGPGNRGFVTNFRWHILDALPFHTRMAFYLELISHDTTPGMSYARIAYHYGRPGLMDDHAPITDEDLRHLELRANYMPAPTFGARNARFHQAEDLVKGKPTLSFKTDNLWSGGRLMLWHPTSAGDEIEFRIPVKQDAPHAILIGWALTPQSGRVSVKLDGEPCRFRGGSDTRDLHVPYRQLLRQYEPHEDVALMAGDHVLTIRFEGSSGTTSDPVVGIDYIGVQNKKRR